MSIRQAIESVLKLFVIFVFFSASFFFFCLAYLPKARILIEDLLLNHYADCIPVGIGFFIASSILTIGFYGLERGRMLHIKMGKHSAEVDPQLIRQTIEEHFKKRFKQIRVLDVEIARRSKMSISVELTEMPENVEKLLEQVEIELVPLLQNRFGYFKQLELIAETRSTS